MFFSVIRFSFKHKSFNKIFAISLTLFLVCYLIICLVLWKIVISLQKSGMWTSGNNITTENQDELQYQMPKNENLLTDVGYKFVNNSTIKTKQSIVMKSYSIQSITGPSTLIINYTELQNHDINKLIDLNNFTFLINQPPCPTQSRQIVPNNPKKSRNRKRTVQSSPPVLLLLIHSAPGNYRQRTVIRETWGSLKTTKIRVIFLLGADIYWIYDKYMIQSENSRYKDIVQGNFRDNYYHMTYKHVMAFKWFIYYCPEAKYLLKLDDDVFVNTPELIRFFQEQQNFYLNRKLKENNILPNHNLIFCHKQSYNSPIRNSTMKWYVSVEEYPEKYYPPYCLGYSIIYSPDVVFKLYKLAQNYKYFWIDDVHLTGTIAQLANITITSSRSFILLGKQNLENFINIGQSYKQYIYTTSFKFFVTQHNISVEQMRLQIYCKDGSKKENC